MNRFIKGIKKKFYRLDEKTQKSIILLGAVILMTLIVLLSSLERSSDNFKNIKRDKNNYLVYSKVEKADKTYPKYVPDINIKSNTIDQVNADIDNYVANYLNTDKALVTYEYSINGIILSVVIKVMDYQKEYAPEIDFKTYNINLDTKEVISDQSLLELFQIDEVKVGSILEAYFKNYYAELVKEKYYEPSECDYQCFLGYRGINNYTDNVHYYVKEGNLIAYKPFVFYSIFNDEEYFKAEHFEFLLVETEKN
ncbi:MAG: hypothetical protein IJI58_01520 [Bacilli bacterium]|nr:hypothetical protein [Bacilli bacterium]